MVAGRLAEKIMRVIIYAAGISTRLRSFAKDGLKGLLEFDGKKLIEHQLDWIIELDITEVIIVIGLEHERYVEVLGDTYKGLPIKYVYNPNYKDKGNMLSLWHARKYCDTDILFTTSDLICNVADIEFFIRSREKNKILVDNESKELFQDPDPVKVCLKNNQIIGIRKNSEELDQVDGIAIGLYKFSVVGISSIISAIDKKIKEGNDDLSLYYAVDAILDEVKVAPVFTRANRWFDIDTPEDIRRATGE